jgi:hypothetical protein
MNFQKFKSKSGKPLFISFSENRLKNAKCAQAYAHRPTSSHRQVGSPGPPVNDTQRDGGLAGVGLTDGEVSGEGMSTSVLASLRRSL